MPEKQTRPSVHRGSRGAVLCLSPKVRYRLSLPALTFARKAAQASADTDKVP